ncbi:hypothetical protein [Thalassotalea litorea]|uniref:hypothetical protein n=1 Tax=Thalassotalea litorea TaxID=2020715 RepID=UPI003735DA1B
MVKSLQLFSIFMLAQLLFACSTTESPQFYKAELKESVSWQIFSETSQNAVSGIDFRDGRLVNNIWIIDLFQEVELQQKLMQQKIEYLGTEKPLTWNNMLAETQCSISQAECAYSAVDWLVKPGEVTFIGFTGETKKERHPYAPRLGEISAKLQVKQQQQIVTIPVNWYVKNQKIYVDLKTALEQAPIEPEKAILKIDFTNSHHQYSHKVVFDQYIFNLMSLSTERWQKPVNNIQQWLDRIAQCLPVSDVDCALENMVKIEASGEQVPGNFYYHMASIYLMAGDSEKAKAYAKKYLATASSQQYQHQARAML